jgi:hypothetical protein
MGFFDRLFGNPVQEPEKAPEQRRAPQHAAEPSDTPGRDAQGRTDDDIAVERYHYLLRTAPPETIEKVHQEAFAKLTPEQRELLFTQLSKNAPSGDAPRDSEPASLAVSATRSELRQPGTMERSMGGNGLSFGGMVGSSLLGTVAGYVIGSALVSTLFPADAGADAAAADSGSADAGGDQSADTDADTVSADGGDYGSGGDFGGGDFGGGFDF